MELVRGETLRARLAGGALPVEEVVRIGRQLADALAHAHAQGVVHRDFKSANIVLTPEGRAKVLDFGLAKRMSREALAESVSGAPTMTQPGTVAGTLAYMAPEQLRGQPADARSDVWALGVVLHEMATGTLPFPGETGFEMSAGILHQPPLPLPATMPGGLRTVIARCLVKDPAQRYARGYVGAGYAGAQKGLADVWASRYGTPRGWLLGTSIGERYLYAGDRNRALDWFEKAVDDRDPNAPYFGLPIYESMRSDLRFQTLLRRIGLPQD